jgi:hypothetical protein
MTQGGARRGDRAGAAGFHSPGAGFAIMTDADGTI